MIKGDGMKEWISKNSLTWGKFLKTLDLTPALARTLGDEANSLLGWYWKPREIDGPV